MKFRITALPDGLNNYQLRQWSESFNDLKDKMISFGFKDEVNFCFLLSFNKENVLIYSIINKDLKTIYRMLAIIILLNDIEFCKIDGHRHEGVYIKDEKIMAKSMLLLYLLVSIVF